MKILDVRRSGKKIIERFRELHTANISDALDRLEIKGVIVGIRPLFEGARIAGPAFTIKRVVTNTGEKELAKHVDAIDNLAEPGDVIVIDAGGCLDIATWGGCAATFTKVKGIEGIVIDGSTRDSDYIRELKFPIFVRGCSPLTSSFRMKTVSINANIKCGGVQVRAGDIVVGDGDGIVIIPKERAEEILITAEKRKEYDDRLAKELNSGKSWKESRKSLGEW